MRTQSHFDQQELQDAYQLLMRSLRVILQDENKSTTYQTDQAEYYQSIFTDTKLFQRFDGYLSLLKDMGFILEPLLKALDHAKILCDADQKEFSEIHDVSRFIHEFIRDPVWNFHYTLRYPEHKKTFMDRGKKEEDFPLELWKKSMSFFSYRHQLLPMKLTCKTFNTFAEDKDLNVPYAPLNYNHLIAKHIRKYSAGASYSVLAEPITCFAVISAHEFLASENNVLYVYDLRDMAKTFFGTYPKYKEMQGHTDAVITTCLLENNRKIVTGSRDKTVRVWDLEKYTCLQVLEGHTDAVNKVIQFDDLIASVSADKTIRIWDWKKQTFEILLKTTLPIIDMIKLDGDFILCTSEKSMGIYSIKEKKVIASQIFNSVWIKSICLSSENTLLVSIINNNDKSIVYIFNIANHCFTNIGHIKLNSCFANQMLYHSDGVIVFYSRDVGEIQKLTFYSLEEKKFLTTSYDLSFRTGYIGLLPDNRIVAYDGNLTIFPFAHKESKNNMLEEKPENRCLIS